MTVTVGLIGCGGVAGAHVHGVLALGEGARITAVADVVAASAERRAAELGGAAVYSDYRELIRDAGVDSVIICLPHHLHAEAIVAAAEAGKHVLCEKPLCITAEDAERVATAVSSSGITLMCAHNQLFLPPVMKAREIVDSGVLGRIYEIRTADVFFNRSLQGSGMGWRGQLATAGGGELIDSGYHPTYLLLHLATGTPVSVVAMTSRHRLDMEGEDSAHVLVRFDDGSLGSIVTSWAYLPTATTEKFSIVAEHGTVWSDGLDLHHQTIDGPLSSHQFPPSDAFTAPYDAEVADFVRCVAEGRRPIDTEVEGIHVLKVILAAYASVAEQRVITLAEL